MERRKEQGEERGEGGQGGIAPGLQGGERCRHGKGDEGGG